MIYLSAIGIIASVAIFLYGVFKFGHEIRLLAVDKIKETLSKLTSNPVKGLVLGFVATGILQSSTATSVLIATLADAGLVSFYHSLGIIFGANIGTTITSQLVAFNVMSVSPFIILLGLIFWLWGGEISKYSKAVIYFGLIFFAIYLVSIFVGKFDPELLTKLLAFTNNSLWAIVAGIIATLILQSSSVVTGLVLVLAGTGQIDFQQSIGLILGANIGTTSTVIIASLAMNKEAKRVALSHFLFNLIGVLILFPFLGDFYFLVDWLDGDLVRMIANTHLIFNVFCAILFLILIKPFSWLIMKIIK